MVESKEKKTKKFSIPEPLKPGNIEVFSGADFSLAPKAHVEIDACGMAIPNDTLKDIKDICASHNLPVIIIRNRDHI
jgi:hypothetical protein